MFAVRALGALLNEMFAEKQLSTLEKLLSSVETRTEGGAQVWVASDGSGSGSWVDPTAERLAKIVITGDQAGSLDFDVGCREEGRGAQAKQVVKP